jgi:hypothetical protein
MAKRASFRRDATPPAWGFHEYAEAATEWVFRYKFTVIVTAALLVGVVALWVVRGGRSTGDTRAWQMLSEATTAPELEQALPGLKGTSAYSWAALRLGAYYYQRDKFTDAERVLEPLATDDKAPAYPRGLALYVLGCTYLEAGDTTQAKNSFGKALTVNGKSPFLQELVGQQEAVLKDWPPKASAAGETTAAPAGTVGGTPPAAESPTAGGSGTTSESPAATGGDKTTERPAAGSETRSEAPTGKQ